MKENSGSLNDEAIKLSQNGLYTEAIACFRRAITLERDNWLLWFNLGLTLRDAGFLEEAITALETANSFEEGEENPDISEALAVSYFDAKDFDNALETCFKGLEINPVNAELWNTAGAVYFNKAEYTNAMDAFETSVTINPYYPEALYNLRDTYLELKNENGAKECEEKLKALKKNKGDFN